MIELPPARPYAAMFTLGARRVSPTAVEEIGSIIVKAGYQLVSQAGGDTHRMQPDQDPAASALVVSDQGAVVDGSFVVTREADVAPFKPVADIVVEGLLGGPGDIAGEVKVDGVTWLTRTAPSPPLPEFYLADRKRNLFGYQPRSLEPRRSQAGHPSDPDRPPTGLGDLTGYEDGFLNVHRRGGGFSAAAAVSAQLVAGQRVTVRKADADVLTVVLSVTLTHPPLTALYRTWCGRGPDRAPYWTRVRLGAMRADTLILRPDVGRAEVIWRATWPWANEPSDAYRAVRVSEGVT